MQFQAFNKILIDDQKIRHYSVGDAVLGFQFFIRYPSYRGTFLSCIEKLDFYLDGEKLDPSQIRFTLEGKEYLLEELKDQYKTYWFVLSKATITVLKEGGITSGRHEVTVDMFHRIPYAGYGGKYLALPSVVTKTLETE